VHDATRTTARFRRSLPAALLAAPAAAAGVLTAHGLAYALATPGATAPGHAYLLRHLPALVLALVAVALIGALAEARRAAIGAGGSRVPLWPVALAAPLAFVLQEHLEFVAATGSVPLDLASRPTFALGLLLQLPFALGAVLVARLLQRSAQAAGTAARRGRPHLAVDARRPLAATAPRSVPARAFASGIAARAPPRR
jgi:hypothetical protein